MLLARGRASSAAREADRAIPQRALPMMNPSLLAADGTPPHYIVGRRVEVGCEDARTPLAAWSPPARHGGRRRCHSQRRGGDGHEAGPPLGPPPGGSSRRSDRSLRRQKMGEIGDPGLGHDRCHLHFEGRGFSPPLAFARRQYHAAAAIPADGRYSAVADGVRNECGPAVALCGGPAGLSELRATPPCDRCGVQPACVACEGSPPGSHHSERIAVSVSRRSVSFLTTA